jgi:choline transporter-like protein 2/4/5
MEMFEQEAQVERWQFAVCCYVMIAVDVVVIFVVCYLRKYMNLAVGILREASRAVQQMPALLLFPVFPALIMIGLTVCWLYIAVHLAACGSVETEDPQVSDHRTITSSKYKLRAGTSSNNE